MEQTMKKKIMQLAAVFLAMTMCVPTVWGARTDSADQKVRVGLASSSSHNATGELACAHLQNNTGFGAGYRFGYYNSDLNFVELARTGQSTDQIAVLKARNMYYGYDSSAGKYTYSESSLGGAAVGCYHIQIPGSYVSYSNAAADAQLYGGFVAWIDGAYQVRVGSYLTKEAAQAALADLPQGTVVGTSAYGMNVVETGTNHILFQFDAGKGGALGILPDVTGAGDVRTWFSGYKYRGGFTYQRVSGNDLTVVNVLPLEDYIRGVICYEMGNSWPLEALKAQAICARTYVLRRLNYHGSLGFDVCNSDACQVYRGVGSNRADYGPSDTSDRAASETAGQVLWYNSTLADTYYSASHGGASESAYYVWGTSMTDYPYLCGVKDPYEASVADRNSYSSWTVTYSAQQLTARLQSYGFGTNTSLDHLELTYSDLGNVIQVKLCYANGQSNTITPRTKPRGIRALFGLNSIRFTVNGQGTDSASSASSGTAGGQSTSQTGSGYPVNGSGSLSDLDGVYVISGGGTVAKAGKNLYTITGSGTTAALRPADSGSNNNGNNNNGSAGGKGVVSVSGGSYVFNGSGNGHQVGMSQFGANAMARQGFAYDDIVEFYFPGTHVGSCR